MARVAGVSGPEARARRSPNMLAQMMSERKLNAMSPQQLGGPQPRMLATSPRRELLEQERLQVSSPPHPPAPPPPSPLPTAPTPTPSPPSPSGVFQSICAGFTPTLSRRV